MVVAPDRYESADSELEPGLQVGGRAGRVAGALTALTVPRGSGVTGRDSGSARCVEVEPPEEPPGPLVTSGVVAGPDDELGGVLRPGTDDVLVAPPFATALAAAVSATLEPDVLPLLEDNPERGADPGLLEPDPLVPADDEPEPLRAADGADLDDDAPGDEPVDDAPPRLVPFASDPSLADSESVDAETDEADEADEAEGTDAAPLLDAVGEESDSDTIGPVSVAVGVLEPALEREDEPLPGASLDGLMRHLR